MKAILGAISVAALFQAGLANKCQCGIANDKGVKNRIEGGSDTPPHKYPWMVGVGGPPGFCGGSLISSKHVLTAAHCVNKGHAKEFVVIVGAWDIHGSSKGKRISVRSIHRHKGYDQHGWDDIAILELATSVSFNKKVRPVCLPIENNPVDYNGKETILTGWGGGSGSKLDEADLNVIPNKDCNMGNGRNGRNQLICTHPAKNKKGACGGDSGSPLVTKQNGKR